MTVGDGTFFRILKAWTARNAGGEGTTQDFATLAGQVAHRDLSGFFDAWVFSAGKPPYPDGGHPQGAPRKLRLGPLHG